MVDWELVNVGDKLLWVVDDFDGHSEALGVVFSKHQDHCIVKTDGMDLWLDKDTEYMFIKVH